MEEVKAGESIISDGDGSQEIYAGNQDQVTMDQMDNIRKQIADSCSLVGDLEDIASLSYDYLEEDHIYQVKLQELFKKYGNIRRTRGDGNCFYRCFGFKVLEECLKDSLLVDKLIELSTVWKDKLIELGYPKYTVEDFHETYCEVLQVAKKSDSIHEIVQMFNDNYYSDYSVVFLRLIVSCYLQENEEFYSAFIDSNITMKEFCSKEVEPMSRESDHINIIALTNAFRLTVLIEYMDRSGHTLNHHLFPDDGSKPIMYLLYRPGHYDILYQRQNDLASGHSENNT